MVKDSGLSSREILGSNPSRGIDSRGVVTEVAPEWQHKSVCSDRKPFGSGIHPELSEEGTVGRYKGLTLRGREWEILTRNLETWMQGTAIPGTPTNNRL